MVEEKNQKYLVPNLEKGIEILELLAFYPEGLTQQEIRNRTNFSATTIFRITMSLQNKGYVTREESTKRITLTKRMLHIGLKTINENELTTVASRYMRELRDEIKETICLGVMGDGCGIFVQQVEGTHLFKFTLTPGKNLPLHAAAPCKAMMAYMSNDEQDRLLAGYKYERYNDNTIKNKKELMEELATVKDEGLAYDKEEELHGVVCAAAPIFDHNANALSAIWYSAPKDRISKEMWDRFNTKLKETAMAISIELGYQEN